MLSFIPFHAEWFYFTSPKIANHLGNHFLIFTNIKTHYGLHHHSIFKKGKCNSKSNQTKQLLGRSNII